MYFMLIWVSNGQLCPGFTFAVFYYLLLCFPLRVFSCRLRLRRPGFDRIFCQFHIFRHFSSRAFKSCVATIKHSSVVPILKYVCLCASAICMNVRAHVMAGVCVCAQGTNALKYAMLFLPLKNFLVFH